MGETRLDADCSSNPWLHRFRPVAAPRLRLFAFPHAGASAASYQGWQEQMSSGVEVVGIQLPGRLARWREPMIDDLDTLVSSLSSAIGTLSNAPFALFGHSLGGLLCFEVARRLRAEGLDGPLLGMIVSGCAAPQRRVPDDRLYALPDAELLDELRSMKGTAPEILDSPEMLELVLPAVRADFRLAGRYRYEADKYPGAGAFDVPIHMFAGAGDPLTGGADASSREAHLQAWQAHTHAGPVPLTLFAGDHFFIDSHRAAVIAAAQAALTEMLLADPRCQSRASRRRVGTRGSDALP